MDHEKRRNNLNIEKWKNSRVEFKSDEITVV